MSHVLTDRLTPYWSSRSSRANSLGRDDEEKNLTLVGAAERRKARPSCLDFPTNKRSTSRRKEGILLRVCVCVCVCVLAIRSLLCFDVILCTIPCHRQKMSSPTDQDTMASASTAAALKINASNASSSRVETRKESSPAAAQPFVLPNHSLLDDDESEDEQELYKNNNTLKTAPRKDTTRKSTMSVDPSSQNRDDAPLATTNSLSFGTDRTPLLESFVQQATRVRSLVTAALQQQQQPRTHWNKRPRDQDGETNPSVNSPPVQRRRLEEIDSMAGQLAREKALEVMTLKRVRLRPRFATMHDLEIRSPPSHVPTFTSSSNRNYKLPRRSFLRSRRLMIVCRLKSLLISSATSARRNVCAWPSAMSSKRGSMRTRRRPRRRIWPQHWSPSKRSSKIPKTRLPTCRRLRRRSLKSRILCRRMPGKSKSVSLVWNARTIP
jgi:hypothetical protein